MKKTLMTISLILVFCCFISILAGCVNAPTDLDEAVEGEIIDAFVAVHSQDSYPVTEDEVSLRCYGAFDGVYVLFVDVSGWAYTMAIKNEVIAGVKFVYSCGQTLTVYADGAFYSLSEAYENKILSRQDLKAVQRNYKGDYQYLYRV